MTQSYSNDLSERENKTVFVHRVLRNTKDAFAILHTQPHT